MMNKFFITVGQVTVGVIVGNLASEVLNKVAPKVKDIVKHKKGESK